MVDLCLNNTNDLQMECSCSLRLECQRDCGNYKQDHLFENFPFLVNFYCSIDNILDLLYRKCVIFRQCANTFKAVF